MEGPHVDGQETLGTLKAITAMGLTFGVILAKRKQIPGMDPNPTLTKGGPNLEIELT
jgi:hypothetical protein